MKTLKTHEATSHKEQHGEIDHNKTIPCDQCDKKFDLELKLKKHKQVTHTLSNFKTNLRSHDELFKPKPEALELDQLDGTEDSVNQF